MFTTFQHLMETHALMYAQAVNEHLGTAEEKYYECQPKLRPSQKV